MVGTHRHRRSHIKAGDRPHGIIIFQSRWVDIGIEDGSVGFRNAVDAVLSKDPSLRRQV